MAHIFISILFDFRMQIIIMKLFKHKVYSHLGTRKHKKINNTRIKILLTK